MFGALFGFAGEVSIAKAETAEETLEALMKRVETMLEGAKATRVWREGPSARFTVRLFRLVSKTNVLGMIDAGSMAGEDRGGAFVVSYQVSTRRFTNFAAATIGIYFTVAAIVWAAIFASPSSPPVRTLALAAVFVVALYALNLVVARARFKRWLRAGLTRAAR